jgi:formate hydrogenlyase subunit 6/NADH:ubiquinone oxidoreductase subunit I
MYGAVNMKALPILKTILQYIKSGPVTIRYPAVPAKRTPATRGHLEIQIDDCIFCGLCRMHCPSQAIEVSKPDRTWQLDIFRCIVCSSCVEYCPKDCLVIRQTYSNPSQAPVKNLFQGKPEEKKEETISTE